MTVKTEKRIVSLVDSDSSFKPAKAAYTPECAKCFMNRDCPGTEGVCSIKDTLSEAARKEIERKNTARICPDCLAKGVGTQIFPLEHDECHFYCPECDKTMNVARFSRAAAWRPVPKPRKLMTKWELEQEKNGPSIYEV